MVGALLDVPRRFTAALAILPVFCCTIVTAQVTVWNGGAGSWNSPNWSNGAPDSTTSAQIDQLTAFNSVVTLAGVSAAKNLTVGAGDQLDFAGQTLDLAGTSLANNGSIKASGPLNFAADGTISGNGTLTVSSTVTATQLSNTGNHTIKLGDTAGSAATLQADTIVNGGLITTSNGVSQADLIADSITNSGTLRTVSSSFAIRAPAMTHNGVIETTGSAGSLRLNQDNFAGGMQVTGSGRWDVQNDSSLVVLYPVNIATTGEFNVAASGLFVLFPEAAGSTISMSNLSGGGTISGTNYTLKVLHGDPAKPFTGSIMNSAQLIKTGSGTQVFNSQQEYTGGTLIQSGVLEVNNPDPASPASTGIGYGDVRVQNGGTLAGNGSSGAYSFIENGGTLAPGHNGPGAFHFFGLNLQAGAKLDLELGNGVPSDSVYVHDAEFFADGVGVRITNIGMAVGVTTWFLDWTGAQVGITPGNSITASDFSLVNSGQIQGSFVVDTTGERVGFLPTLLSLAGDYNGNGVVDGADFLLWRNTLGQVVAQGTGADGNSNGLIDQGDYAVWRGNFGRVAAGSGLGSGVTSIPEPTSGLLLLSAMLLSVTNRRHRSC